jgi:hypothetical protein
MMMQQWNTLIAELLVCVLTHGLISYQGNFTKHSKQK